MEKGVENICIGCIECILNEYNLAGVVAGYDDKGNNIIVACPNKNYCEGENFIDK